MQTTVIVTLQEFYNNFPEFNKDEYTDICPYCFRTSKTRWGIKNTCILHDDLRNNVIYLYTAHLSKLTYSERSGQTSGQGGFVAGASVDGVSVNYVQPPSDGSMFNYWLSTTPYGLELLAILDSLVIPRYIGGSIERVF